MSTALDIDAGMASYVGAAGVEAAWGAGREAARAAAIEVAAIIFYEFRVRAESLAPTGTKNTSQVARH